MIVLLVSAGLTFFIPGITVTPEMIARDHPGLFDILVAAACGFIGAYSFINKRISAAIPGVAISVALLPPLCTMGIGLGLFEWELARGAALLFAINLICVSLAALIVFYLVKLHPQPENKKAFSKAQKRAAGQIIISIIFIIFISVPLIYFTVEAATIKFENEKIHTVISSQIPDEEVYSMEISRGEVININCILLGSRKNTAQRLGGLESKLKKEIGREVEIVIYSIDQVEYP